MPGAIRRMDTVGERTRIINRMKAALIRLGIRGFKPELRRAPKKLDGLRTPEDLAIPPNTLNEISRDMARLAMVREQIDVIEQARVARIAQAPSAACHDHRQAGELQCCETGGHALRRVQEAQRLEQQSRELAPAHKTARAADEAVQVSRARSALPVRP
jgi:hypothetical protein